MKRRNDKSENLLMFAIIIIAAIPLWLPVMVLSIDKYYFTPTRNIEANWNIDIPSGFKQLYHTSSDNIYAKGDSYTVYEASGNVSDFLKGFNLTKQASVESYLKDIIIGLSVSKEHRPSFQDTYYYMYRSYGGDMLLIAYFPETSLCYFAESFSWDN